MIAKGCRVSLGWGSGGSSTALDKRGSPPCMPGSPGRAPQATHHLTGRSARCTEPSCLPLTWPPSDGGAGFTPCAPGALPHTCKPGSWWCSASVSCCEVRTHASLGLGWSSGSRGGHAEVTQERAVGSGMHGDAQCCWLFLGRARPSFALCLPARCVGCAAKAAPRTWEGARTRTASHPPGRGVMSPHAHVEGPLRGWEGV